MKIKDIIQKRKQRWSEKYDIEYDKALVEASVVKILETPNLIKEVINKPYLLIEVAFTVVDKNKSTIPFFLNEVQQDFINQLEKHGTNKPYFILKGRQQGFTTLITAMQLAYSIVQKNFSGFTIADCGDNTKAIFNDKARVVYSRLPNLLKPQEKFNSVNELFFDKLNSSWRIATATDNVGRSRTLNFVHFSEVAFFQTSLANLQKGIGEAITQNAIQIYETTANGFNEAKDLWDSETCVNLFYEWWRTKEYRSTEYDYLETNDAWLKERIKVLESKGLEKEQITWYCKKYSSYLDKSTIKQEYPITPTEAFISSGDCVFDKDKINNQLAISQHLQPIKTGYFEYKKVATPIRNSLGEIEDFEYEIKNIKFIEDSGGYIKIYEEPVVKIKDEVVIAKAPYVIGGDTAGLGDDFYTAKVKNNMTGFIAATLHKQRLDDDLYAEQLYCLGKYYHEALIGIETNYSRQPTRILEKYSYPSLYLRERIDSLTNKVTKILGFETTSKTKPVIISELIQMMRDNPECERDIETLKEMTVFVRKENGKTEAQDGYHDDLVMALAICNFISSNQTKTWILVENEEDTFLTENFNTENQNSNGYMSWDEF